MHGCSAHSLAHTDNESWENFALRVSWDVPVTAKKKRALTVHNVHSGCDYHTPMLRDAYSLPYTVDSSTNSINLLLNAVNTPLGLLQQNNWQSCYVAQLVMPTDEPPLSFSSSETAPGGSTSCCCFFWVLPLHTCDPQALMHPPKISAGLYVKSEPQHQTNTTALLG